MGSFVRIDEETFVASPELCFVQMATKLSFPHLVELGFEFCGSYVPDSFDANGMRRREPLTKPILLRNYLDRVIGIRGTKLAKRALRYVVQDSASPKETTLTMLLCLPLAIGGYGIPMPKMNHRIDIDKVSRGLASKSYYVADLCWPGAKLVVEYDSNSFHTGPDRIASDSKRRNALESMGFTVVSVTWNQIRDPEEFDKVARIVMRHLGKRLQPVEYDIMRRRWEVRSLLLRRG